MSRFFAVMVLVFSLTFFVKGQDNSTVPDRTPEQEATKQTEKLKQDLRLSPEQVALAHEINLKYARARQTSNTRAEAVQRMKDKEADLMKILNYEQRILLQNKRYERSSFRPSSPALRQQNPENRPTNTPANNTDVRTNRNQTDNSQTKDNTPTQRSEKTNKQAGNSSSSSGNRR